MRRLWLILLLLTVGCSPKFVVMDSHGYVIPHEVNMVSSVAGLQADFYFCRVYEQSEDSNYTDYLPIEEEIKLPKDTKAVFLNLHIKNPEKVKFKVVRTIVVDGESMSKVVYKGKSLNKVFQFPGPLVQGKNVRLYATIYIDGRMMIYAGRAIYKIPHREGGDIKRQEFKKQGGNSKIESSNRNKIYI